MKILIRDNKLSPSFPKNILLIKGNILLLIMKREYFCSL